MRLETLDYMDKIIKEQKTKPDYVNNEYDDQIILIWQVPKQK
jgi:hypothetical protein